MDGLERVTTDRAIALLAASGVDVDVVGPKHVDLLIGRTISVEVKVRQHPPTPSQRARDLRQARERRVMYVVPRLTQSLRNASVEHGLAVVAVDDGIVLIDGEEFRPTMKADLTPIPPTSSRRTPWGRYALIRMLCMTRRPRTQARLADECGITQAAISQTLRKLDDLVVKSREGWTASNPRVLADLFLSSYPGAGGIGSHWFSMDSVTAQADRVLGFVDDERAIVSGDVAADWFAPWRVPAKAIVYASSGIELAKAGFAPAPGERATLELRVPADPTLWATATAWTTSGLVSTTDPLVVVHDIQRTGGADAGEAMKHVLKQVALQWEAR